MAAEQAAAATQATFPAVRLTADLPAEWQGEVIGPGITGWQDRISGRFRLLRMPGTPDNLRTEIAWMAYWQYRDGCVVDVQGFRIIAQVLTWQAQNGHIPESLTTTDPSALAKLYARWFIERHGRLPGIDGYRRMHTALAYPRLALTARLNAGPWWAMDTWSPRCDPRIPLRDIEPDRSTSCAPGRIQIPWLQLAVKWMLGTRLESGELCWATITDGRVDSLARFDRWLASLTDPAVVWTDADKASALASAFRLWTSDPRNRTTRPGRDRKRPVSRRRVNNDLHAVSNLMRFVLDNRDEARRVLGPSPWEQLSDAQTAAWSRLMTRRRQPELVHDEHYVDDHDLAQITACLPALGMAEGEVHTVDLEGRELVLRGCNDPQAMRMLLLQILTGRRASEVCLCDYDCLLPATSGEIEAAEGEELARFRYAQTKIDSAPDTILVDSEVIAIFAEQRAWITERYPGLQPRYLFLQRHANANAIKPYNRGAYDRNLLVFSKAAKITDTHGNPVELSHTRRFRHTKPGSTVEMDVC